jgi:hypothetical protein
MSSKRPMSRRIPYAHLEGEFSSKNAFSDSLEGQIRVLEVADRSHEVLRWREQDMNALRRRQRRRGPEAPDFRPRSKQVQTQMIPPSTHKAIVLATLAISRGLTFGASPAPYYRNIFAGV